jgi:5-methylcytosine-specific restriction endonuclease McrA
MTLDEQEKISKMRADKLVEQNFKCAYCGKGFCISDKIELSHIIPQRKYLIKLYGKEIIHHELNMKLCHAGECNSGVQLSPNKTELVEAHVEMIKEAIANER